MSLLTLAAPAFAQEAPPAATPPEQSPDAPLNDADIVVSARRREENLQDVPLVVNAVTGQAIEKLNLRNFQDITSVVPGLALTPNANGIGSSSSIRGVNHDVNVSGENGTIQYYMGDAPVQSGIVLQTMYDIAQIEVLRGPQGTLRGRATPSGSITVTTRQPDLTEAGGYVGGTYASANAINGQFGINVPVWQDKLAVRIAGLYDKNSGDRVHSINSTLDPYNDTRSLRATVRFEPLSWLKAGFMYQGLGFQSQAWDHVQSYALVNPAAVPTAGAPDYGTITQQQRLSVERNPRTVSTNFKLYNWNAEADYAGQRLIYVGSRQISQFDSFTPVDSANFFPALNGVGHSVTGAHVTTHEIRLQNESRIAGMFDYVVGYFNSKGDATTQLSNDSILRFLLDIPGVPRTQIAPPSINTTQIFLPRSTSNEESYFGNLTAHLGEGTEIAGGLRHIRYTSTVPGVFIGCTAAQYVAAACAPPSNGSNFSYNVSKTVYSATIR
ncbi:MAG: TonB-dependent receptor, partial [Novosphingobium sp.]|nr:TonB-dependent receptor [Novosphingobium sp.]